MSSKNPPITRSSNKSEKFTKQLDINPFLNDLSDKDYQEGILNLFYSSGGVESGIWKIVRLASTQNGQDLIFELLKARNEYKEHIDNYTIAKEFINRNFDLENNLYSNNEIKKAIVSLKNTHIFSFLFIQSTTLVFVYSIDNISFDKSKLSV